MDKNECSSEDTGMVRVIVCVVIPERGPESTLGRICETDRY